MSNFLKNNSVIKKLNKDKPGNLKWKIVKILLLAWLLPVTLFTVMIIIFSSERFNSQIRNTVATSTEKAIQICESRLENDMAASRNASYITDIKDAINKYSRTNNHTELYKEITRFLDEQYKYNDDFLATFVCMAENTDDMFFTINNTAGATYDNVKFFTGNAKNAVVQASKNIDTDIAFVMVNGRMYMVRNVMGAHFKPIAVIVMEINTKKVFESFESVLSYKDCMIMADGYMVRKCQADNKKLFDEAKKDKKEIVGETSIVHKGENAIIFTKSVLNNCTFEYSLMLDGDAIFSDKIILSYMLSIMAICLIPLVIVVFYFFYKKINRPVDELMMASEEIISGNYGYQIENINSSEEFMKLGNAFNRMSEELRLQFEQRYVEELALRDANIRALQSQINPHFLNNTLEIINWEARMNGNEKVCGMIEALSTMTEATMNRKKQPMVTLKEELTYVDAYLYIIRQRFGEKFELVSEIDDSLEGVMVPRLIIQPIIENAVEHGGDMYGRKKVNIAINRDGDNLKIVIRNNGALSDEDIKKVENLLSDDFDEKNDTSTSIGIRNVNKRLKIIYGKEYGLTITHGENEDTISTLTAKIS